MGKPRPPPGGRRPIITMRRDQPTTPFDVEADDLTQQFWGAAKGWVSSEQPTVARRADRTQQRDDTTGSLRVIREGFAAFRPRTAPNVTGEVRRQRQHGSPRRPAPNQAPRREATLGELADGRSDVGGWLDRARDDDDPIPVSFSRSATPAAERDVPLTPAQPLVDRLGLGAVDPLLVRTGLAVLALILLVPVMLSLRPDRGDTLPGEFVGTPQEVVAGAAPAPTDTNPVAAVMDVGAEETTTMVPTVGQPTDDQPTVDQPTAAPASEQAAETDDAASITERALVESAAPSTGAAAPNQTGDEAAVVDVAAERIVPACPQTYTASPGDSWYRIADEAGVAPSELLAENNATTNTVILPGDDICLPEGASMPSPPSTTVASTTGGSDDGTTPTTTQAPTTTEVPVANLSRSEVQELIRQTWPDDEVDTALAVARRESNFVATADNGWCCYGVFQIYWSVHAGWLDDFGIDERSDLFDARKNVAAAHAMWERSGWGPWGG